MNRIGAIIGKELRLFLTDRQQVFFSLLMPLALIAMMVGAFGGSQPLNITGYVVDLDQSPQSAALLSRLAEQPGVKVRMMSEGEAVDRLERSDIASYLVVTSGFGERIADGDVALAVRRRGNGGTEGQIFISYAVAVASDLAGEARQGIAVQAALDAAGLDYDVTQVRAVLEELRSEAAANPRVNIVTDTFGARTDGAAFFVPGIVSLFALFSVALASEDIVAERKNGTLERLMTTRLSKGELLAGKLMAFGSRTLLQIALLFAVGWAWFKLFTPATFAHTMLFSVAVAAAGASFGLLVSAFARSTEQAVWGSVIITNVSAMLGGSYMVVAPGSLIDKLGRFTLNYYANAGYRAMINQGVGLDSPEVMRSFLVLIAAAAGLMALAVPAFRIRGDA